MDQNDSDTTPHVELGDTDGANGWNTVVSPSIAIVERLAELENRDPVAMEPLGASLDLDALDSLLSSASGDIEVTFDAYGWRVTVDGDGRIEANSADADGRVETKGTGSESTE